MWGAAPRRCRQLRVPAVAAVVVALLPAVAGARIGQTPPPTTLPADLWGLEVDRGNAAVLSDDLAAKARQDHVNTLLLGESLKGGQRQRIETLAQRLGWQTLAVPTRASKSVRSADALCTKMKTTTPQSRCTALATSVGSARMLAASTELDVVVVHLHRLPSPSGVRALGAGHARVVAVVDVGRQRALDSRLWNAAITQVATEPLVDLAVTPVGARREALLGQYLRLLAGAKVAPSAETDRA